MVCGGVVTSASAVVPSSNIGSFIGTFIRSEDAGALVTAMVYGATSLTGSYNTVFNLMVGKDIITGRATHVSIAPWID